MSMHMQRLATISQAIAARSSTCTFSSNILCTKSLNISHVVRSKEGASEKGDDQKKEIMMILIQNIKRTLHQKIKNLKKNLIKKKKNLNLNLNLKQKKKQNQILTKKKKQNQILTKKKKKILKKSQ